MSVDNIANAIVVVPVHKSNITDDEKDALEQCVKVLFLYDIVIVAPNDIDLEEYIKIFKKYKKTFKVVNFDNKYFRNYRGYNKLCLTQDFYKKFQNYEYMLICHADAWVFRDELSYWCSQNYDYIGAPLDLNYIKNLGIRVTKGGNGGFSLRKIKSMIDLLSHDLANKNLNFYKSLKNIYIIRRKKRIIRNILRIPTYIFYWIFQKFINWAFMYNEDLIIAYYAPIYKKDFKIAPDNVARKFALEYNTQNFYKEDAYIPFGSHNQYFYKYLIYKLAVKRGV